MRKLIFVLALAASPALANGYSAADAAYVTSSHDPDVLNYVVCLATNGTLERAQAACRPLAAKIGAQADDIVLNVMECGFRPGDASPDMGCE